ncbi:MULTISPECIES: HD domain-containing protein [unclassified Streptomyces]|jgi:HD superfamily phosphodiesterase|uniref:HD domain-containing protein n=1 Tax=unclassified Streptomyces TaxID=2593676 RepID=UPI001CBBF363|nr:MULTISPECIES: HD domain-containing protein [unclassified Streptomyces]WPO70822.1 HD domain-containing protein [Streptomyces sp. KN37]
MTIADIKVPDSVLAKEATELVRDTADELIFHHSRRVYLFGALQGNRRGLSYDAELLYVGAMFHDLGLTEKHRTSTRRFEIDGAEDAKEFLLARGVTEDAARVVWEAIALHTTPEIPTYMAPEIALVTAGVELDVLGIGYDDIADEQRAAVVAAHPRPDFKRRILQAFNDGIAHRPDTTFGNIKADVLARYTEGYVRPNFVDVITESRWPE